MENILDYGIVEDYMWFLCAESEAFVLKFSYRGIINVAIFPTNQTIEVRLKMTGY